MRWWLGLVLSSLLEIHITFELLMRSWPGHKQFPCDSDHTLIENCCGLALSTFLKFILHSNGKLMRFWLGLALSSVLEIPITF